MAWLDEFQLYKFLVATPDSLKEVSLEEHFPIIASEDIDVGRISRYFARQANQQRGTITEVSKRGFEKIRSNRFFVSLELTWRVSGPLDDIPGPSNTNIPGVLTANRLSLNEAEKDMPGMQYKILNVTQFYNGDK